MDANAAAVTVAAPTLGRPFCIETSMQVLKGGFRVGIVIFALTLMASAALGSFRGTIIDGPDRTKGWIYVQGRNGSARRVQVLKAKVVYDEEVPAAERHANPEEALGPGAEVRVTAEQAGDGEWHASLVEILKGPAKKSDAANQRSLTDD